MGEAVICIGDSGSGKSYSLRNFDMDKVGIFECAGKRLPFKGGKSAGKKYSTYDMIKATLAKNNKKAYVIDDAGYLMSFDLFSKINDKDNFKAYKEIAKNFEQLVEAAQDTDDDTIVYFLLHVDRDASGMRHKPKTVGKMVDDTLVFEGLTNILIQAYKDLSGHHFRVNTLEELPYKSPPGMFDDDIIDNDMAAVDTAIRDFYNMAPLCGEAEDEA